MSNKKTPVLDEISLESLGMKGLDKVNLENVGLYRLFGWVCPESGWFDDEGNEVPPTGAAFQMLNFDGKISDVTFRSLDELRASDLNFAPGDLEEAIDRIEKKIVIT